MAAELKSEDYPSQWESAHVCSQCGFSMDLAELGLRGITTGLVTCPKCDWSGSIEIRILNRGLVGGSNHNRSKTSS